MRLLLFRDSFIPLENTLSVTQNVCYGRRVVTIEEDITFKTLYTPRSWILIKRVEVPNPIHTP